MDSNQPLSQPMRPLPSIKVLNGENIRKRSEMGLGGVSSQPEPPVFFPSISEGLWCGKWLHERFPPGPVGSSSLTGSIIAQQQREIPSRSMSGERGRGYCAARSADGRGCELSMQLNIREGH